MGTPNQYLSPLFALLLLPQSPSDVLVSILIQIHVVLYFGLACGFVPIILVSIAAILLVPYDGL